MYFFEDSFGNRFVTLLFKKGINKNQAAIELIFYETGSHDFQSRF